MKNTYAENFVRLSLAVNSRGIEPDENEGFIVSVDLTGTVYFDKETNVSEENVTMVLKDAFRKYNKLFLDILADSIDPFLSAISYAIVIVDGDSVVDEKVNEPKTDSNLPVWTIAVIAAAAGFIAILALCLCFICCLGDPEEEDEYPKQIPQVSKSSSGGSGKSKNTAVSSRDEEESYMYGNGHEHLEARSISSQDSSKFTYNPKSVFSYTGNTYASFNTNVSNMDNCVENWQKASTMNQSTAFGNDISGIEEKRDLSHIVERDEESGASSQDLSTLNGLNIATGETPQGFSIGRQSLNLSGTAKDVIDDLNDLSQQVAKYKRYRSSAP